MYDYNDIVGQGNIVNVVTSNGKEYKSIVYTETQYPNGKAMLIFSRANGIIIRINPSYIESIEDAIVQAN
uniref:Uncharacterized protein n=1 Tax=viral metagenome TaxID=1070528 RepID=A0A6H1ZTH7_9ZZZZ